MKHVKIIVWICFFVVLHSLSAQETADEIIRMSDEAQKNESEILEMEMRVFDDFEDTESDSEIRLTSTGNSEGDSVIVFSFPRSVNGLAILSTSEGQWVHFPSTGRVRKISSKAQSGSVQGVGGDFSYEDLGSGDWGEDYSFTLNETLENGWILTGKPLDDDISYSAIRMMIHNQDFLPRWIEFFKGGSRPEKKLFIHEIKEYDGVFIPVKMEMRNEKKGSKTEINVTGARINVSIDESMFNPRRFFR